MKLGNKNSECKKYLHIIKANNLINLRKTSNKFRKSMRGVRVEGWGGGKGGELYTQKRAKLFAPPPFGCSTNFPYNDIRICQLTIERFSFTPTAMLYHYYCLYLPLSPPLLFTLCWPLNIEQPLTN